MQNGAGPSIWKKRGNYKQREVSIISPPSIKIGSIKNTCLSKPSGYDFSFLALKFQPTGFHVKHMQTPTVKPVKRLHEHTAEHELKPARGMCPPM